MNNYLIVRNILIISMLGGIMIGCSAEEITKKYKGVSVELNIR